MTDSSRSLDRTSGGHRVEFYVKALTWMFVIMFLGLVDAVAHAASFDCGKSTTTVEKAICADPRLSKLDEELTAMYRHTTSKLDDATVKREIQTAQRVWLKSRNACKDGLCIEVLYRTRIAALAAVVTPESVQPGTLGKFWLTYGIGTKVCEAYLERLNSSFYEHHPKCDRPESDKVPGFQPLDRATLSPEDLLPFWASVKTFLDSGDPERWKASDAADRRLGRPLRFGDKEQQLRRLHSEASIQRPFRFGRPVDVDNDGVPDSVVMWRTGHCGRAGRLNEMRYWTSIPIVLNADGSGPDVERTRRVFGHPSGGYRLSSGEMSQRFRPIGTYMGIFEFEGKYYIDTFFDSWGDFRGQRQYDTLLGENDPEIANRLAVFEHRGGDTQQVCEYWLQDISESGGEAVRK